MTLNTAETKGKDPILGNKYTQGQEAILDPDILNHQKIIDINHNIVAMTIKNCIKTHTRTKTTVDHAAILTPEVPAEVNQIRPTEKDQTPSIGIGHLQ